MECPICFEIIAEKDICESACKHQFCRSCLSQIRKISPTNCPLCRRLLEFNINERFTVLKRKCIPCNISMPNVFSKCQCCRLQLSDVNNNVEVEVKTTEMDSGTLIMFVNDFSGCKCCYNEFGQIMFQNDTALFHIWPNSYIETDLPCPFLFNHSFHECPHIIWHK